MGAHGVARQLLPGMLAVALVAVVTAKTGDSGAQGVKPQWVIAFTEEADTLYPARTQQIAAELYLSHMFEALVGIEGENLTPVGRLAERWESVSPTVWRFHLRRGVKFHNGEPFEAEDVKASLERYADPKSARAHLMKTIERVEIRDANTIDLVTVKPFGGFLTNLTRLYVMPRRTVERGGPEAFARQPVGTGPYRFGHWQRDQQMTLEANPTYWGGAPTPSRLVFRPIRDASTRAAELKSGGVDVIVTPPLAQIEALDSGDTQVVAAKAGRLIIYGFNLKKRPFDDVRVRQAVNYAVDRFGIVKNVLRGRAFLLAGPITLSGLGYDPSIQPYPYDPGRARQLLADAGYPQGFDTTWKISSGVFLKDTEIAEAVSAQLRQVGIRVTLMPTDRATLTRDNETGNFDGMTSVAWGSQFEPDPMLGWVFGRPHFGLPKIHELMEQGRSELDQEKRRKIYQALSRVAHDEATWLFVHAQDELWAKRRDNPWTPYGFAGATAHVLYYRPRDSR